MYPKVIENGYVRWQMSDNIFVEKNYTTADCGPHCHDYIEIVYVCRGQLVQNVDNENHYMARGNLLLLDYGTVHSYHHTPGTEYYNVFLKLGLFDGLENDKRDFSNIVNIPCFKEFEEKINSQKKLISFSNEERAEIETLLEMMDRECQVKRLGFDEMIKATAIVLVNMILRKMSDKVEAAEESIAKGIIEFMYNNYSDKLTLEQTAMRFNYNPVYFGRLFKKYTGFSFREYLKRVRIEKATELLKNKEQSIDDICFEVGYNNKTKFFEHFKSIMGTTPNRYRKNALRDTTTDKSVTTRG